MSQADHRPVDHQGRHHQCHQQLKRFARDQIVNHHADQCHESGQHDRRHRHAAFVDLHQRTGSIPLLCQTVKHTTVAINTTVVDRQRCRQNHHIENVGGEIAAERRENQHKRTATFGQLIPRIKSQQHSQRPDIKDQDAIDHLIHGARDALPWVVGFCCCDTHQLQATKREHDDGQRHDQTMPAIGQETTLSPEVGNRSLRTTGATEQ